MLRIHIPNDDRLFPGRSEVQMLDLEDGKHEWAVDKIITHSGSRKSAVFEVLWKTGDKSWLPYTQIGHLRAVEEYLEACGAKTISDLPKGLRSSPPDDPQVFLGSIALDIKYQDWETDNLPIDHDLTCTTAPMITDEVNQTATPPEGTDHFAIDANDSTAGFIPRYANGDIFEPRDEVFGNAHLYRRRNGSFYCVMDRRLPIMEIPEGLMKKYLMFDALARKNMQHDPVFHTIQNELPQGITVPAGFHDFARSMNADAHCPWSVAEYEPSTRLWTWPDVAQPRSRGPVEIMIDYPTDDEIRDIRGVMGVFREHGAQRINEELVSKHVLAFQENVMLQMQIKKLEEGRRGRRGSPYGANRPTSRIGPTPTGFSPQGSRPGTPFSGAMGQLGI
ncbi:hypothetical protein C0991_008013 [Blastosporella zonata]|nr:hypothetical protein C0991_008013 [Blastosporella zonata]